MRLLLARGALAALAAFALALPGARTGAAAAPARELWFWQSVNLADAAATARIAPLWRRAAAAGYSRVVLSDARFARPADLDGAYLARVRELRALAASLRLEIVPAAAIVGRGNGALLAADPNLAEALPVRGAPFEVRGGIARPVSDPPVTLPARPDRADLGIEVREGAVRIAGGVTGRATFTVTVAPWRLYHVSVRITGAGFSGEPRLRVSADGRELAFAQAVAPKGDAPETRDLVFDSQEHTRVTVGFSLSRASRGAITWSDWRIEEAGPVNLVRRPGITFRFNGLVEGRDHAPVIDPALGMRPWRGQFDTWHEPPVIHVNRPDGTRLRASWWSAAVTGRGQVAVCLSDTAARARVREEIVRVREMFGARTVMLMHDEIRCIGQDASCEATGHSAGRILADHVRDCAAWAAPARVCVWNDMFDPQQNAVKDYFLVRGDLAGSWDGLAPGVTVVNWNGEHAEGSLRFFADRGHEQVWAGYYDGAADAIRGLLPALDRTPAVTAIMYTTWQERWDDLEAFARAARGR